MRQSLTFQVLGSGWSVIGASELAPERNEIAGMKSIGDDDVSHILPVV